jgi:hypothetical protein
VNPRQVSNLAVVHFASGTDFDTFVSQDCGGWDQHCSDESQTQDTSLKKATGFDLQRVAYKGTTVGVVDWLAERTHMMLAPTRLLSAKPTVSTGAVDFLWRATMKSMIERPQRLAEEIAIGGLRALAWLVLCRSPWDGQE